MAPLIKLHFLRANVVSKPDMLEGNFNNMFCQFRFAPFHPLAFSLSLSLSLSHTHTLTLSHTLSLSLLHVFTLRLLNYSRSHGLTQKIASVVDQCFLPLFPQPRSPSFSYLSHLRDSSLNLRFIQKYYLVFSNPIEYILHAKC